MSRMINVRDVRLALGLSAFEVITLVQTGRLRSYRYVGDGPVSRESVTQSTQGLRFKASDVDEMIENSLVK